METEKPIKEDFFVLKPKDGKGGNGFVIKGRRVLVGRSESCEVVIPSMNVSTIHAVLELSSRGGKIYDMNSTNGTFVNGHRIVVEELKPGDQVSLGSMHFSFEKFQQGKVPPVLDILQPTKPREQASISSRKLPNRPSKWKPIKKQTIDLPSTPIFHEVPGEPVPRVVYPLAADPKADFSEYIFEDLDKLYPIFKYETGKQSIEIIILFRDRIFSVDYVSKENGTIHLVGQNASSKHIEFPHLGENEKFNFIDVSSGCLSVHKPYGYEAFKVGDQEKGPLENFETVELKPDEILRLKKNDLEIYVRLAEKPPKVSSPPVLRRDPEFRKYLFLVMMFILIFLGGIHFYVVDKEIEKEKRPERIATILYKRKLLLNEKKAVAKTEIAPKKVQKAPKQERRPKEQPKKITQPSKKVAKNETVKPRPVKKTGTNSSSEKRARSRKKLTQAQKQSPKTESKKSAAKQGSNSKAKSQRPRFSKTNMKSQGKVSAYKSPNLSSSMSSLLAKGGSTSGVKAFANSNTNVGDSSAITGGDTSRALQRSKVSSNINLSAATQGLDQSKGAEGLVSKRSVFTVGVPSKTVVLGSIDPDDIKRILRDHIPQFQYCYQSALDKSSQKFSGLVGLSFTIGASGHVTQAGVAKKTSLPADVKGCVLQVLKGIKFPEPLGGGTVSVRQAINFYPVVK